MVQPPFIITIAGLSAAGKSTLAADLAAVTGAAVLKMDDYYRDIEEWGSGHQVDEFNWDRMEMFHLDELADDLASLKRGSLDSVPVYDFTVSQRTGRRSLAPTETVILEGQFALAHRAIREVSDLRVFVDLDIDLAKNRRVARDQSARGRSVESILHQWESHVVPAWRSTVQPSQCHADIVVAGCQDRSENVGKVVSAAKFTPAFLA